MNDIKDKIGRFGERIVKQYYDDCEYADFKYFREFFYLANLLPSYAEANHAEKYCDFHYISRDEETEDTDVFFGQVKTGCISAKGRVFRFKMGEDFQEATARLNNYRQLVNVIENPPNDLPSRFYEDIYGHDAVNIEYHFWHINPQGIWYAKHGEDVLESIERNKISSKGIATVDGCFEFVTNLNINDKNTLEIKCEDHRRHARRKNRKKYPNDTSRQGELFHWRR